MVRNFLMVFLTIAALGTTEMAWAESRLQADGASPQARLDFRSTLPTLLYLQLGTTGATLDRITFKLNNIAGTGAVQGTSSGTCPEAVRAAGFVPNGSGLKLVANSSTAMSNGGAGSIPFNQISCTAATTLGGPFASYTFDGTAAPVLNTFSGSGNKRGTYTFTYANANYYETGTYIGHVTYTLSLL